MVIGEQAQNGKSDPPAKTVRSLFARKAAMAVDKASLGHSSGLARTGNSDPSRQRGWDVDDVFAGRPRAAWPIRTRAHWPTRWPIVDPESRFAHWRRRSTW